MFISMGSECETCKILKQQLDIVNAEKAQMLQTLLDLTKPEVVQAPPTIVEPIAPKAMVWRKRREILEEEDRNKARAEAQIEKLEKDLGVTDATGTTE